MALANGFKAVDHGIEHFHRQESGLAFGGGLPARDGMPFGTLPGPGRGRVLGWRHAIKPYPQDHLFGLRQVRMSLPPAPQLPLQWFSAFSCGGYAHHAGKRSQAQRSSLGLCQPLSSYSRSPAWAEEQQIFTSHRYRFSLSYSVQCGFCRVNSNVDKSAPTLVSQNAFKRLRADHQPCALSDLPMLLCWHHASL